jgi:hypothetical protein
MPGPKNPDREHREAEHHARSDANDKRDEREEHEHRDRDDQRHKGEHEREARDEEGRPKRRRMGREHAVHQQIVEKRLSGGAPATSEAYANALEQWQQLPGSVMRPPTDEKPKQQPASTPEDQSTKEE